MKIEHVALNVEEPVEMARWYVEHLEMRVVIAAKESPHKHFLVDRAEQGIIELYNNSEAPVPDYRAIHPLVMHIAFAVEDVDRSRAELVAAGAIIEGEIARLENGDIMAMVRDPWGIPLQLACRSQPLV